jgi:hypothetical protein
MIKGFSTNRSGETRLKLSAQWGSDAAMTKIAARQAQAALIAIGTE